MSQPLLWEVQTERNLFHICLLQMVWMWTMPKKSSTITSRPWTLTYPHNMTHCTYAISWQTAIKVQVPFYLAVMFNLFCLFWRNIPRTKQNHMVARSEKCHGCNLQNLLPHTLQGGCPEMAASFSCTSNSSSWKLNSSTNKSLFFCNFSPLRNSVYASAVGRQTLNKLAWVKESDIMNETWTESKV